MRVGLDKFKLLLFWGLVAFMLFAGINHFWHPEFYLPLIPPYIPMHEEVNILAGFAEVALAIGLIVKSTRQWASWGLVLLMLAFIPSHIYFIQLGGCVENGWLCTSSAVAWLRLVLIHPLLIWWMYWAGNYRSKPN